MKTLFRTTVLCLFWFSLSIAQTPTADSIFINGKVYTAADRAPKAEAVAVKDGKVLAVGSKTDVLKLKGPRTKTIDLRGATLTPGFTDAHCHLAGIGFREIELNLEGTTSLADFLAKVKARVAKSKPGDWITGRGWIETFWNPPTFPTRADLDTVSPRNPVFLQRADGHGAVANSLALRIAGIDKTTPNPFGGEIMHDKATGDPNGMLLDRAHGMIMVHIPKQTEADLERALLLGIRRSLSLGWCEIQIAGNNAPEYSLLEKLYGQGKIDIRIYDAVSGPSKDAATLIDKGPVVGAFDQKFTRRAIKIHFDGALGSKGAALLEPYADYDTTGFLTYKEEDVLPMLVAALRNGIQVETHAIGDRANRTILDWYEKAFAAVPPGERKIADPRWRVEHAQIVNPVDLPRFARLGVIPSMQPSHAIGDLHFAVSRIGLKRLEGAYAWQSFITSGAIVAGGSDAPVERGEPMIEFYAAVARKDLKGFSGEGWHPEEAVSRSDALKMFTLWAAKASFEETTKGTIEPGKLADFSIFSADIMEIPFPEILKTRCVMTVVGGKVVYAEKSPR